MQPGSCFSGSLPGWTGKGASLYLSRSTSFSSRYDKLRRIQTEFSTHWETNKEIPLKSVVMIDMRLNLIKLQQLKHVNLGNMKA